MSYVLSMSILHHSQQLPSVIACLLSIECSELIGDAPYAYVEIQNLHMNCLSTVRLKVTLLILCHFDEEGTLEEYSVSGVVFYWTAFYQDAVSRN